MSLKSELRDNDRGYAALKKEFERMADFKPEVKVGILGDSKNARDDGPLTNVEIGTIHEFGSPSAGIPERSFLRSTVDLKAAEYRRMIGNGLRQLFGTKGIALQQGSLKLLELVGMRAAADVKNRITQGAGIGPALAQSTIDRKGSSRPLVDTGQMVGSISWRVGRKGSE